MCTQSISVDARERHLASLEEQLSEQAGRVLAARRAASKLTAERQRALEEAARRREGLEARVAKLTQRAEAVRLARAAHAAWLREGDALRARHAGLLGERDRLEAEENTLGTLAETAEAERATKAAELDDATRERERLEHEGEQLAFWDRGFGPRGLKSYLLDSVLPLLNERARHYGELLTGGALAIQFSTVTEKDGDLEDRFAIQITHRSGVDSYALLSGGERQRCNLIINLALQDLVASRAARPLPLAIYDEAFEGLDRTGVEAAVRVLAEAARTKDLVLVVTHQDSLRDLFTHELRVVCERGRSTVETVS